MAVGHIVPGGAADLDGRIRSGDEIVSVEGFSVLKASHQQVVQLINAAAARGQVSLILRRCMHPQMLPVSSSYSVGMNNWATDSHHTMAVSNGNNGHTYDVTVQRTENEGFGFVIISSANKIGSTVGKHHMLNFIIMSVIYFHMFMYGVFNKRSLNQQKATIFS